MTEFLTNQRLHCGRCGGSQNHIYPNAPNDYFTCYCEGCGDGYEVVSNSAFFMIKDGVTSLKHVADDLAGVLETRLA